ncbi:hypothetical protein A3H75_00755 [Candidatus Uhrbacteria bacterium RIFCSPLOWO2_02_FULL_51_9]|uniref:Uncharacterized protein n=1 Tax=Candidatus Uhrbacteria bacterium RIFCSPLOWO2_02_FULL_51_9 TaxID=1802410 RepID=A0A1F7VF34_9BACT|nr:MAG: hypothetical protein A3H75_00755 [Candidatus Uhrbacteria bacterium RIFCSPLOWO2_02_FULL_51_9]
MTFVKQTKDQLIRFLFGGKSVPRGLFELSEYNRLYGPISFKNERGDGVIIAVSTDFRYGSIVTSGKNEEELEENIKDAILTSFEIPSSYAKEARVHKVNSGQQEGYAIA